MRFQNNKLSRYFKNLFMPAWIGATCLIVAVIAAMISQSVWTCCLAAVAWLLGTQFLYILRLLYLVRVEKKRRSRFMLRGDGHPLRITELQSRVIKAVGYDETRATLMVEFRDGRIKYFCPVSTAMHLNLINAPSPGTYYKHHIRALHNKR